MDLLILSQGASFSPIKLFMDADLVVKAVIIGLALASIWVWTIIVSFVLKIRGVTSQSEAFEREFWKTEDVDGYYKQHGKSDLPIARVFAAGLAEWRRSTAVKTPDRQGTRERLATAMDASIAAESEKLANRLNFLATTGAVAPFVGLFGTVWGIMRSFSAIAAEQNSSLAVDPQPHTVTPKGLSLAISWRPLAHLPTFEKLPATAARATRTATTGSRAASTTS